jgi:hypothetical protein
MDRSPPALVDIPELVTGLLMSDIAAGAEQGTGQLDEREEPTPPAVIVSLSASMSASQVVDCSGFHRR